MKSITNYADTLSNEMLYHLHWYKEIKSPEERRKDYRRIREAGLPACWANRARDWSVGHIDTLLTNFKREDLKMEKEIKEKSAREAYDAAEAYNAALKSAEEAYDAALKSAEEAYDAATK